MTEDKYRLLTARLVALVDELEHAAPDMGEELPEGEVLAYCAGRIADVLRSVEDAP